MKKLVTSVLGLAICASAMAGNGNDDKKILSANAPVMAKENFSKDSTWKYGGIFGINLGQVAIGDYWAAGGFSNYTVSSLLSVYANKKKGKISWDSNLDLAYGVIKQGNRSTLDETPWIKSDDRIEFSSKAGYKFSKDWHLSLLFSAKTQMSPGYVDPYNPVLGKASNFMAPGYFFLGLGADYKPNDNFTLFLSPLTAKVTVVNDEILANAGAFGVTAATYNETNGNLLTAGEMSRYELGAYLKMMYKKDNISTDKDSFLNGISFMTKLDLFSNYLAEKPSGPQNIDVNWETLIGLKVNKYITATVTTQLIYDHDINFNIIEEDSNGDIIGSHQGPRVQFKEALAVGFSYKF